jgi:hypothetical protein
VDSVDSSRCPTMAGSAEGAPDPYGLAETVNGSLQVHRSILGASVGQKSQNSFGIHRLLLCFCCYE